MMTSTYRKVEKEQRNGAQVMMNDPRMLLGKIRKLLERRQSQDILPLIESLPLEEDYWQELAYILAWNYFLEQHYQKVFQVLGSMNGNEGSADNCQHDYHALT